MSKERLLWLLNESQIAAADFPLKGVGCLYPYGMSINQYLEDKVESLYSKFGYKNASFPEIIPEEFTTHLSKDGLFKVKNEHTECYLSPGTEQQAAWLATKMIQSYRDLPLRLSSHGRARRQTTKSMFLKDFEFQLLEYHGFFSETQELEEEKKRVEESFCSLLDELHIPHVAVDKTQDTRMVYGYFDMIDSFGSLLCVTNQSTKFTNKISYDTPNREATPYHLNFGTTSRLLAAFLTNNYDDDGFRFPGSATPVDVYLTSEKRSDPRRERLAAQLENKNINYLFRCSNNQEHTYKDFLRSGIPIFIGFGISQTKVRLRENPENLQWFDTTEQAAEYGVELLSRSKQKTEPTTSIQISQLPTNNQGIPKVYEATCDHLIENNLSRLGSLDSGKDVYVERLI